MSNEHITDERAQLLIARLNEITKGIDKTDLEDAGGWWSTGTGADFGERVLTDLKALLLDALQIESKPTITDTINMIAGGGIGPCRGIDLQYRSRNSCGWPRTWRATLIKPDTLGASPTAAYGDTPDEALRGLVLIFAPSTK